MPSYQIGRIGAWSGLVLVALGLAYLGLIAAMMLSGSGFPPAEPFQTMVHIVVLVTAVGMVFFWTILHQATPLEKKLFSRASLAMIVIFAALTSINRYVGLTVVRQSLAFGTTDGLQWFLPYRWPSVMLAVEFLAWGIFFGLGCLSLAPVFTRGKLECSICGILLVTGVLSVLAAVGQVMGSNALSMNLFTLAGMLAWGPGLTTAVTLMVVWFRKMGTATE